MPLRKGKILSVRDNNRDDTRPQFHSNHNSPSHSHQQPQQQQSALPKQQTYSEGQVLVSGHGVQPIRQVAISKTSTGVNTSSLSSIIKPNNSNNKNSSKDHNTSTEPSAVTSSSATSTNGTQQQSAVFLTEVNISTERPSSVKPTQQPQKVVHFSLIEKIKTAPGRSTKKRASSSYSKRPRIVPHDLPLVQNLAYSPYIIDCENSKQRHGMSNFGSASTHLKKNGIDVAAYHSRDAHYGNKGSVEKEKLLLGRQQRFPLRQYLNPNLDKLALNLFKTTTNFDPNLFAAFKPTDSQITENIIDEDMASVHSFMTTSSSKRGTMKDGDNLPPITTTRDGSSCSRLQTSHDDGLFCDSMQSSQRSRVSESSSRNRSSIVSDIKSIRTRSRQSRTDSVDEVLKDSDIKRTHDSDSLSLVSATSTGSQRSKASYFSIGSDADSDRIVQLEENLRAEELATKNVQDMLNQIKKKQEELFQKLGDAEKQSFLEENEFVPDISQATLSRGSLNNLESKKSSQRVDSDTASVVSLTSNHSNRSNTSEKLKSTEEEVKQLHQLISQIANTVVARNNQPEKEVKKLVAKILQKRPDLLDDPTQSQTLNVLTDDPRKNGATYRSLFYRDYAGRIILN